MSFFEEKSGIVQIDTPWGHWYQTIEEVYVRVNVNETQNSQTETADSMKPICGRDVKCTITNTRIKLTIRDVLVFEGEFPQPIHGSDAVWTLEDKKIVQICLPKSNPDAGNVWPSLLKNQFEADLYRLDQMKRKQTLERFQADNPGMDFSHSTISGNYENGGPQFP